MLKDKKILVTGAAGNIGFPLARSLARDNEVWGLSRYGNPAQQAKVEAAGIVTRSIDLGSGDYGDLPTDFDYVLHLAAYTAGDDYYAAVRSNAEGTTLLMTHCRKAKAFLSMSSTGVYQPHPDPWHAFLEEDPLGGAFIPGAPHYSMSKVVQEGVARAVARQLGLPTIIARMNAAYGPDGGGGLPGRLCDQVRDGEQVMVRWDPNTYSPIHDQDIFEQAEAFLDAASPTAPIVNWGGDEPVSAQQMIALFGEIMGRAPDVAVRHFDHSQRGVILDTARRMAITGPCKVHWRDGMREMTQAHVARVAEETA